tara:strand:+ start:10871 stop:17176 length:6306 start_codon:yes stop_codon:yes gene_type:complete
MAQEQSLENMQTQGADLEFDNLNITPENLSYPNSKNGTADLNLYRRQDVVTGTTPYSQKQTGQPGGYDKQYFNQLGESVNRSILQNQDTKRYAKPMAYDSSSTGQHKARYLGYGQETYDRIGFNPMIDNEALFNAHTSQFDDWVRMATVAAPMYIQGFLAPMKSYAQAFSGNFGADTKEAIDFEEASAIGYSTKGGALGFLTNVQNSVAYSAGVMTQAVLENALVGAVVGTSAGPGGTAAGGIGGALTGLVKGLIKLPTALGKMALGSGKMLANLKNAKNFEAAKDMFVAGSKTTANFFNPLENTADELAKNVFSNADNLGGMARAARTAGGFYRDVNLINSGLSEGRLEGGFTENETYKTFYDEHWKRFNKAPTSDEQLEYRKRAKLAGFQNTWQNTLLITYSNKIAFPNLFRGNFMSQVVKKVGSGYNIVLEKGAKGAVDATFKLAEVNLKSGLKSLAKPGTYGKVGLNYFKTNLSEGFQEVSQDVLSDANKNYYVDSYYDKSKQTHDYAMATLWSSMGKQANAQGFETFASGFVMGGFLRPFNGMVPTYLAQGYQKYYKQRGVNEAGVSNYKVYKEKQETEAQVLVNTLNDMTKNGADFLNGRAVNYGAQSIIAKKQQEGKLNKREVIDSAHRSFVTNAVSAIQAGTYDMWLDNFKTFKNLTPEQIEEVWELEKGEGQKALNHLTEGVTKAEQLKKAHAYAVNNISKKKVNLMNLKPGTDAYEKAVLNNKAVDASAFSYVYLTSMFQDNLERVNRLYSKMAQFPSLKKLTAGTIQDITETKKLNRTLSMLKTEIDSLDESAGPSVKEEKEKKNEIYYALRTFQAAQKEWNNAFLSDKNLKPIKQKIKEENPNIQDNELEKKAIEELTAKYEAEGVDPMNNYKEAFVDLLKTLSEDEVDYHSFVHDLNTNKSKNIDDIFEDLVDVHYLKSSNKNLVPYINFLSAPDAFNEHTDRNLKWMTDLYENRNTYHKQIVNQSFQTIANRDALQTLADQGIYMDLDQFSDYMEDQTLLPEFFIDSKNERIITSDSVLYDKYLNELNEALELKDNPPAGKDDTPEEQLNFLINEKNKQRNFELREARLAFRQDIEDELGAPFEQIVQDENTIDTNNAVTQSNAWKFYQKVTKGINKTYDEAIEALKEKYKVVKEVEPATDAMAKSVQEVKDMLLTGDDYVATRTGYIIKGKLHERMTNRIRQNYDNYNYDERGTIEEVFDKTIGTYGLTENSVKDFISALKKKQLPGFEDYTYTELEEELKSIMEPVDKYSNLLASLVGKSGDLRVTTSSNPDYTVYIDFKVENGQIVSAVEREYFRGEYNDRDTEYEVTDPLARLEKEVTNDLNFNKYTLKESYFTDSATNTETPLEDLVAESEEAVAAPEADIEAKRADIERRRQEKLDKNKEIAQANIDYYNKYGKTETGKEKPDGQTFYEDIQDYLKATGRTLERAIEAVEESRDYDAKKINAKYDAELAALEQAPVTPVQKNIAKIKAKMKKLKVGDTVEVVLSGQRTSTGQNKITDLEDYGDGTYRISFGAIPGIGDMLKDVMVDDGGVIDVRSNEIFAYINFNKPAEDRIPRSVQKDLDALNDKIDNDKNGLNARIEAAEKANNPEAVAVLKQNRQLVYDQITNLIAKTKEALPEIKSNLKNYIVNTAIENTYESAKANGNYLDKQIKNLFDPNSEGPVFDPKFITQEAYDSVFGEKGYLTDIKRRADEGEFYVFSTDLIVYADNIKDSEGNPLPPVAGEIDFIFVDREGRKFIVDLKTGKVSKFLNYNTIGQKSYEKKIENTLQQVGYANLAQKRSGNEFQIAIFPLELNYESTGFITKAGKPSNPLLMLNQKPIGDSKAEPFIINLDKNMKFRKEDPENPGTFVDTTAMDFMEEFVTGPVDTSKKPKGKKASKQISQEEVDIVNDLMQKVEVNAIKTLSEAMNMFTQNLISKESFDIINAAIQAKLGNINEEATYLPQTDQEYILISDIFGVQNDGIMIGEESMELAKTGDIVTVIKVDETNNEIILRTPSGNRFSLKIEEMNDYIQSPETLAAINESEGDAQKYDPTQTEIDFAAESIINAEDLLRDADVLAELKKQAQSQSSKDRDDDLFSNTNC